MTRATTPGRPYQADGAASFGHTPRPAQNDAGRVSLCRLPSFRDPSAYLMLPMLRPEMNERWKSRKSSTTGSTIRVEAAISRLYLMS